MNETLRRPLAPFGVLAAFAVIATIALFRLPSLWVDQFERSRPLSEGQAGWAYRLLVVAALGQACYGGFVVLLPDRIKRTLTAKPMGSRQGVVDAVARVAAFTAALTVVYGIGSFLLTGERGGYWLFVVLLVGQAAWYYRRVGELATWLGLKEQEPTEPSPGWTREPEDYTPPIARGLGSPAT